MKHFIPLMVAIVSLVVAIVALIVIVSSIHADPPTQEDAQQILRQEEERLRNYERYRAEIVDMVPSMERAELNWLARLGDAGYFDDAPTVACLDGTGPLFLRATLRHMEAAALLPRTYGGESDKPDSDALERAMLLAKGGFGATRTLMAEIKKTIKHSPRWATWLEKSGLNTPPDDPQLNHYIALAAIPRELNEMAATLDAGLVAPTDFPQLDGFGPLFLKGLYADDQTEEGRKLIAEVESQVQALYDAWLKVLGNLNQSERWVAWVDALTAKGEWRNTPEEQAVLTRLIAEERAAQAEKAKEAKK